MKQALGTQELASQLGISDRQIRNWLSEHDRPHAGASGNRQRAERAAVGWAAEQLQREGRRVPVHPLAAIYAHLLGGASGTT